ncbi:MAG: hypothetical protein AAB303_01965 [Chloroflexota bacterium]
MPRIELWTEAKTCRRCGSMGLLAVGLLAPAGFSRHVSQAVQREVT